MTIKMEKTPVSGSCPCLREEQEECPAPEGQEEECPAPEGGRAGSSSPREDPKVETDPRPSCCASICSCLECLFHILLLCPAI